MSNTGAAAIDTCAGFSGTIGRMFCLTLLGASYMNLFWWWAGEMGAWPYSISQSQRYV